MTHRKSKIESHQQVDSLSLYSSYGSNYNTSCTFCQIVDQVLVTGLIAAGIIAGAALCPAL